MKRKYFNKGFGVMLAVLFVGVLLTLLVSNYIRTDVEKQYQSEFSILCNEIRASTLNRLNSHAQLLHDCASFISSSDTVTQDEWDYYVKNSRMGSSRFEVHAVGYNPIVTQRPIVQHIGWFSKVCTSYNAIPSDSTGIGTALVFLEPVDQWNKDAIGYNAYADTVRRKAMRRACDYDMPVLTGKLGNLPDLPAAEQAGVVMYEPVYRRGGTYGDIKGRRAAVMGWVSSACGIDGLMKDVLMSWGVLREQKIQLKLYDGDSISEKGLLFESKYDSVNADKTIAKHTQNLPIDFYGSKWMLHVSRPDNNLLWSTDRLPIVFFGGILVSLLLAFLFYFLVNTQQRAETIAAKLVVDLKSKNKELYDLNKELNVAKQKMQDKNNQLIEHQLLFETMFNTIKHGVVITNTQREIIIANKGMENTFGYLPDEVIGKSTEILYAEYENFCKAGKEVFNDEANAEVNYFICNYRHKDHTVFAGETFGAKLYNSQREWIGNLGIMADVSEREQIINDIKIAKERAEESDRLKTEFINNMSHEIRTPMNGILGFSGFLTNPNLSREKTENYVKIIQNCGQQLMRVIDDILEISKLGTKQVKVIEREVCLNDLLFEHFSIFDIKAKENKTPLYLRKGLSDAASTIFTDDNKLNKVLANLIENALKFTNVGFVEFGYQLKNNELEIYVKDTGIGIRKDKQEAIFERFAQEEKEISKNVGGLGLGLSIAKENAELLGGRITIESEKGQGATFFVRIPYKPVNLVVQTQDLDPTQEQRRSVILVVEDEEVNYLYTEALLEGMIETNHHIAHAKNGKDAIVMCRKDPAISMVLMDLKMPELNGFEATRIIKEFRPELPIVAQTAYTSKEDRDKAMAVGCDDFISKPLSETVFVEIVRKYLNMTS